MASNEELFGALCAKAGLYYSQGAHAVLTALSQADAPLTTYELHDFASKCHFPTTQPTVYRAVKRLADAGIITRHNLGDGIARYTFKKPQNEGHLLDVAGADVTTVSDRELDRKLAEIAETLGYRLVRYRLVLYGRPSAAGPIAEAETRSDRRSIRVGPWS